MSLMNDVPTPIRRIQAAAETAWIESLNAMRLESLHEALEVESAQLSDAILTIDAALNTISSRIVAVNRGGSRGMHGFIAEVAEAGIGNARSRFNGGGDVYRWVDDNSPVDLLREGVAIQQKFVMSGNSFGLAHVARHLECYPDFLVNGGRYQLPRDQYETIRRLASMSEREAAAGLSRSSGGPSYSDWKRVHSYLDAGGRFSLNDLEPSLVDYADVQKGAFSATLAKEKDRFREDHRVRRSQHRQEARPSTAQAARIAAQAAAVSGTITFVAALRAKTQQGTRLQDLTAQDWCDIAGRTAGQAASDSGRSVATYTLSQLPGTPAAVAGAITSTTIAIAHEASLLRRGAISEVEFLQRSELLALDSSVSAASAVVGQCVIPVPILGAVIGGAVGSVMMHAAKSGLSSYENRLIAEHVAAQAAQTAELDAEQRALAESVEAAISSYLDLLEQAFLPDPSAAFEGSIALAASVGVCEVEVLSSDADVRAFFLD